jgi:DNA-binding NarL/FixJ family response regulator
MGDDMSISVYVVDDHRLFLTGVESELSEHFDVVGTSTDVDDAVAEIVKLQPDVTLVDVHIPGGGGVTVVRNSLERRPELKFLALSASDASDDVIGMIRAGARGYVTKSIGADDLVASVRRVTEGDAVFSPRLAGFVLDAFAGTIDVPDDPELDLLTSREREVLRLIARGYAYKQVARKMDISIKTVETHMTAVLRKLQLSNRHELAKWASDRRIV